MLSCCVNHCGSKYFVIFVLGIITNLYRFTMKKAIILACGILWGCTITMQAEDLPYKNPKLSVEERVEDLLKRMTVEEKFWQIYMMPGDLDAGKERFKDGIFGFQVANAPDASIQSEDDSGRNRKKSEPHSALFCRRDSLGYSCHYFR